MYYDPEGFTPSVKGVAYQACVKTRYCGHLYSSLLRKRTWVGHRVYKSPYGESGEYTSPSLVFTCAHTQILYSQSLLLTTKVRHISCMLRFMLRNRGCMGEVTMSPIHPHESSQSCRPLLPVGAIQFGQLDGRREREVEHRYNLLCCGHLRCL